jgi:hypothetical protein
MDQRANCHGWRPGRSQQQTAAPPPPDALRLQPFLPIPDPGRAAGSYDAEGLPQQALIRALTALPKRRVTTAQAGRRGLRGRQRDPEMARVYPSPLGLNPEIFRATAEPIRFGETGGPFSGWGRDGGGEPVDGIRGRAQEHSTKTKPSGVSGPWPGGA